MRLLVAPARGIFWIHRHVSRYLKARGRLAPRQAITRASDTRLYPVETMAGGKPLGSSSPGGRKAVGDGAPPRLLPVAPLDILPLYLFVLDECLQSPIADV